MTWIIDYVDYEAVYEETYRRFGMSPYTDTAAAEIVKKLLKQTDKVNGNTVYEAKRNLIHKIGTGRIEFMSVMPA